MNRHQLAQFFWLFFGVCCASSPALADVFSQVNVHGELYDPTTQTVGGTGVLTAEIGTPLAPKTATAITDHTRTISAWTIASAENGRQAFDLSSSIVVPPDTPSARLSAFVQSTNNRVIDTIHVGPGFGPGGTIIGEGQERPIVLYIRLDGELQQQGRPSSGMQFAWSVRVSRVPSSLPVLLEYKTGGLSPPQAFEFHFEWYRLINVIVGEDLKIDTLMSGWIGGTAFDPGMNGTNFIRVDPIVKVANLPGYELELTSEAGADTTTLPLNNRFDDVMPWYWAYSLIETLAASGITSGCGDNNYCPEDMVSRAQMAVFLERGIHGSDFVPPSASGNVFLDVAAEDFAAGWVEQLYADGITAGCGDGNYCPDDSVTRAQMAVFLLRAKYGADYIPPPASGEQFLDVDSSYWAVSWIEQLAAEGITSGCGDGNFCPEQPVTRAQMAVFLVNTFAL